MAQMSLSTPRRRSMLVDEILELGGWLGDGAYPSTVTVEDF